MVVGSSRNQFVSTPTTEPEEDPYDVGKVQLWDGETLVETLPLDSEDMFTLQTFKELITTARDEGKVWIIARVVTRDKENVQSIHKSFYSAHLINRILFRRKKNGSIRHRYQARRPLSPVNPLTNSPIVGEVLYFAVRNVDNQIVDVKSLKPAEEEDEASETESAKFPNLDPLLSARIDDGNGTSEDEECLEYVPLELYRGLSPDLYRESWWEEESLLPPPTPRRFYTDDESEEEGSSPEPARGSILVADYIGTDYHFAHNAVLRQFFARNSLTEFTPSSEDARPAHENSSSPEDGGMTNEVTIDVRDGRFEYDGRDVPVPFFRFVIYFGTFVLFGLLVCVGVTQAIQHFLDSEKEYEGWVYYLVPLTGLLVDKMTVATFKTEEKAPLLIFKRILVTFYYGFHLVSVAQGPHEDSERAYVLVVSFVATVWTACYSCGLAVIKKMKHARNRGSHSLNSSFG